MATTARASLVHHDQAAIGHDGDEFVLEPGVTGTRFFICWIHSLFLLQPFSFLLPSSFDLMNFFHFCWKRCPDLLEPAGGCASRFTPHRRKLHPVARRAASNVGQTPGVATMYAGATTGDRGCCKREWPFLLMRLFLVNQIFVFFAGTDEFLCWNRYNFLLHRLQSSQMFHVIFAGT